MDRGRPTSSRAGSSFFLVHVTFSCSAWEQDPERIPYPLREGQEQSAFSSCPWWPRFPPRATLGRRIALLFFLRSIRPLHALRPLAVCRRFPLGRFFLRFSFSHKNHALILFCSLPPVTPTLASSYLPHLIFPPVVFDLSLPLILLEAYPHRLLAFAFSSRPRSLRLILAIPRLFPPPPPLSSKRCVTFKSLIRLIKDPILLTVPHPNLRLRRTCLPRKVNLWPHDGRPSIPQISSN